MDFIKKHWEKVLLGVVLVGLAVAVAFLPVKIASEKQTLQEVRDQILNPQVKPLEAVDLASAELQLKRAESAFNLDFSAGHRLFNPVLWQKRSDGTPIKVASGNEVGPAAVVPLKTSPLYTILSLDSVMTNETGVRYAIGLERQAAAKAADRRKRQVYASANTKTEFFLLRDVKGPPENPDHLTVEWNETAEQAQFAKDKPFRRVDGYLADLRYPPENRTWTSRREGDKITFGGEEYNIVAINENEVVLSARSGKKTTVRMSAAP
jgi:hypothetical protein